VIPYDLRIERGREDEGTGTIGKVEKIVVVIGSQQKAATNINDGAVSTVWY
jgi:hypothetical protein